MPRLSGFPVYSPGSVTLSKSNSLLLLTLRIKSPVALPRDSCREPACPPNSVGRFQDISYADEKSICTSLRPVAFLNDGTILAPYIFIFGIILMPSQTYRKNRWSPHPRPLVRLPWVPTLSSYQCLFA